MNTVERARAWWNGLAERERRVFGGGAAVLALLVAWLGVWEPLASARHRQQVNLGAARALAVQIEMLAASTPRSAAPPAGAGQSLLAIVDQSSKASAMAKPPSRLQPEGDDTVRIWLDDVPFDALLRWLGELQSRYGVRVDNADIERESGPGLVNARLTLMRGP